MSTYEYSVVANYDVEALDVAVKATTAVAAAGLRGVTLRGDSDLIAHLYVEFDTALDASTEAILRALVIRAGASVAVHRLWCVVCERWYEIASDGRPVYCAVCGTPFQAVYPYGRYVWSDPSQALRRWASVEFFVPFATVLAEPPRGGIELADIEVANVAPPVVTVVQRDGFHCEFQVGLVNAMWQELVVRFSWRAIP